MRPGTPKRVAGHRLGEWFANLCSAATLEDAVKPEQRIRMGDALAALGRKIGLTDDELSAIENRDKTPAEPIKFE